MEKKAMISQKDIESRIFTIRDVQVMLDSDLAKMYQVETRILNQAVKRNIDRFPEDFMFQLSTEEWEQVQPEISDVSLTSQNVILEDKRGRHRKYLPYVFTEQGVAGLSAVLKSKTATLI